MDTEDYVSYTWIFAFMEGGTPNLCIVQGSTVIYIQYSVCTVSISIDRYLDMWIYRCIILSVYEKFHYICFRVYI